MFAMQIIFYLFICNIRWKPLLHGKKYNWNTVATKQGKVREFYHLCNHANAKILHDDNVKILDDANVKILDC